MWSRSADRGQKLSNSATPVSFWMTYFLTTQKVIRFQGILCVKRSTFCLCIYDIISAPLKPYQGYCENASSRVSFAIFTTTLQHVVDGVTISEDSEAAKSEQRIFINKANLTQLWWSFLQSSHLISASYLEHLILWNIENSVLTLICL